MKTSVKVYVRALVFMAIIHLPPLPFVLSEQPLLDEWKQSVEEGIAETNKQNLSGWRGVLLYCYLDGDSPEVQKDICEKAEVNAEFLAATAKINLIKTHSPYEARAIARLKKLLVLKIDVDLTRGGSPAAVSARILALRHYLNAVEDRPFAKGKKDDPLTVPRDGYLVMWEEGVLGATSGASQELVTPISQGIEQHLKKFFTDYLKAQP